MLGNDQNMKFGFNNPIISIQWLIINSFPATSCLFLAS